MRRLSLGSGLQADLATAFGGSNRLATLPLRVAPAARARRRRFARLRSARRPRRRSLRRPSFGRALRAAHAATFDGSHHLAALCVPPSPPLSASAIRSAALCAPPSPPLLAAASIRQRLERRPRRHLWWKPHHSAALCAPPSPPFCASAIARPLSSRRPRRRDVAAAVARQRSARCPRHRSLRRPSLGSALYATVAVTPASAIRTAALCVLPSPPLSAAAIAQQRSARRSHHRSLRQPSVGSTVRAALAAAIGGSYSLASASSAALAAALCIGHRSEALCALLVRHLCARLIAVAVAAATLCGRSPARGAS